MVASLMTESGIRLTYEWDGDKGRVSVVLLHGMGGDLSAWGRVRHILGKKGVPTLAMDIRGHGRSSHPTDPSAYAMQLLSADVRAVVAAAGLRKAVLVGHCFGGMVAMTTAAQQPPWLAGLVLINSSPVPPFFHDHKGVQYLIHMVSAGCARLLPSWERGKRRNYRKYFNTDDFDVRRITSDILWVSPRCYLSICAEAVLFDGRQSLLRIDVPTLILHGSRDRIFPVSTAAILQESIAQATSVVLPGVNHISVLNNPDLIAHHIEKFTLKLL